MTPQQKYSIDFQGLTVGKHHFRFNISDDLFTLWDESEVKKGSLVAEIELEKHSSLMELDFIIEGEIQTQCDRCLEDFMIPVQYEGHLVVKISEDLGEDDGDIMWIHPTDSKLSLAQYIYESIMLSLPYQRVHPTLDQCNQDMLNRFSIIEPNEEKTDNEEEEGAEEEGR